MENEELDEQIGPMLRGEIMCDPNELMAKIAQMREKMDEDHNEINDFDEELGAMRKREKDANVPVLLVEREKQRNQLRMELQKMKDKRRARLELECGGHTHASMYQLTASVPSSLIAN